MKKKQLGTIFIFLAVANFFLLVTVNRLSGQTRDYPIRQIQLVIDRAPGDPTDLAGRTIADQLSKILNVPVVPINKPAAGGVEGADYVAKAKKEDRKSVV